MKKALIDLCLDGSCSDNAVGGVMMLNKMLSMLRVSAWFFLTYQVFSMPCC